MRIKDQAFIDDTIELDGNVFEGCTFTRCRMIFRARHGVGLDTCTFNDVRWIFLDAASMTLSFIHAMTQGLGDAGNALLVHTFPSLKDWIKPEQLEKLTPSEEKA